MVIIHKHECLTSHIVIGLWICADLFSYKVGSEISHNIQTPVRLQLLKCSRLAMNFVCIIISRWLSCLFLQNARHVFTLFAFDGHTRFFHTSTHKSQG